MDAESLSKSLQVVVNLALLVGLPAALWQLVELTRTRNLQGILDTFSDFHERDAYRDRDAILARGPVEPEELDQSDYELYMRTADFFQRLGFLSRRGFISKKYVLDMYSGTVLAMWSCLCPFVQYMRTQQGLTNYSTDFEELAESAVSHRKRRYSAERIRFAEAGNKPWLGHKRGTQNGG